MGKLVQKCDLSENHLLLENISIHSFHYMHGYRTGVGRLEAYPLFCHAWPRTPTHGHLYCLTLAFCCHLCQSKHGTDLIFSNVKPKRSMPPPLRGLWPKVKPELGPPYFPIWLSISSDCHYCCRDIHHFILLEVNTIIKNQHKYLYGRPPL